MKPLLQATDVLRSPILESNSREGLIVVCISNPKLEVVWKIFVAFC